MLQWTRVWPAVPGNSIIVRALEALTGKARQASSVHQLKGKLWGKQRNETRSLWPHGKEGQRLRPIFGD